MLILTRLGGGTPLLLNEEQIEIAEETPDTVITMNNGHRYLVVESLEDIYKQILTFEKKKRSE